MENLLQLNSDKLKREIRLKMKLYEDMLQTNIEAKNIHDLRDYIFILFYDTLPLKEHFNKLKMQNEEKFKEIYKLVTDSEEDGLKKFKDNFIKYVKDITK